MNEFFTIAEDGLSAEICFPSFSTGYYRGTRFDLAGVFRRISGRRGIYADEWFDSYDPYRHDCVCGPSEEFVIRERNAGGPFLKIGVGKLWKEEGPYDRFKRYDIIDEGERGFDCDGSRAVFMHVMPDDYVYEKRIELYPGGRMLIAHLLKNTSGRPIESYVYNHNFFNLGNLPTGPSTRIDFPFCPTGTWRQILKEVSLVGNSIVFSGEMSEAGPAAFIGDLSSSDNFSFRISNSEAGLSVRVNVLAPVEYSVFWSNRRVSCIEPYIPLNIPPGEEYGWSIEYFFD